MPIMSTLHSVSNYLGLSQRTRVVPTLQHLSALRGSSSLNLASFTAQRRVPARYASQMVVASAETEVTEASTAAPEVPDVSKVDIRVGKIISCEQHPDADSLYVEQIDVGEEEPRTIVSGLVKYVPLDQMQDRMVLIVANLKPRNMRGIKSNGMVLCASNSEHTEVEPLSPPEGAVPGERVFFGEGGQEQGEPAGPNQVQKKKIWEAVQPLLRTSSERVATFDGKPMLTSVGPVTTASLAGASIS